MTRYAIIIGVEQYLHFRPTPFAHEDSSFLHSTLTEWCDVEGSSIGDTISFYFAGHGDFSEGKTYLIIPGTIPGAYNTTALALEDLSKELRPQQRACFRAPRRSGRDRWPP